MKKYIKKFINWRTKQTPISSFTLAVIAYPFLVILMLTLVAESNTTAPNKVILIVTLSAVLTSYVTFWLMSETGNVAQHSFNETQANNIANLLIKLGEILGQRRSEIEVIAALNGIHLYSKKHIEYVDPVIDILKSYITNHPEFSTGFDKNNLKQKDVFIVLNCLNNFANMKKEKVNIDGLQITGEPYIIDSYVWLNAVAKP